MPSLPSSLKKWMPFAILCAALILATPVLADYIGPARTTTKSVTACKVVLYECEYVSAKDDYRYKRVRDWSCASESKPWQAYPGNSLACGENLNLGYQYWEREETVETTTVIEPPAVITGTLENCTLQNGWCGSITPQISLNASEPVAGYSIQLIEGTRNGQSFACPAGLASCAVPLSEGENNFSFWALSTWGDSSYMGSLQAKVDTVSPDISLSISGATGANDWYVSPVTVTAVGSDLTSGLAGVALSVDGGVSQTSTTLNEGVHSVLVSGSDNAGNGSTASTTISVDTTTPSISIALTGTVGNAGWYRSLLQVSAAASDATSGIGSLEVSIDGTAYQAYTAPVSFSDGEHTIRFRAKDNAGNLTETPRQTFHVDTIAPTIELPVSWALGSNVPYRVNDTGSGLDSLRLVIEDEDERYAKLAWNESVAGAHFSQDIDWNGQFKDGTTAPAGIHLVWIKSADRAGNESVRLGKITVPETNILLSALSPTQELAPEMPAPPEELSGDDTLPVTPGSSELDFGGEAVATKEEATTHLLSFSAGASGSIPVATSDVLWGAGAAAAISAATAFVLAERRKREEAAAEHTTQLMEEIARAEQKRAETKQKQQENWARQEAEKQAAILANIEKNLARLEAQERRLELEEAHRDALNPSPRVDLTRFGIKQNLDWIDAEMAMAAREQYVERAKAEADWEAGAPAREKAQRQAEALWMAKLEDRDNSPQTARDASPAHPEAQWWEDTKAAVREDIIKPFNKWIYEPFLKPVDDFCDARSADAKVLLKEHVYEPWIQPQWDRMKEDAVTFGEWWETEVRQDILTPLGDKIKVRAASDLAWLNDNFFQPYVKPFTESTLQAATNAVQWINQNVYQPHVQPALEWLNEKVYQPLIQPRLDYLNEHVYQAKIKPAFKTVKTAASELVAWTNENIYEPILAPVLYDINKHIVQPAATKFSHWWGNYGEWVHTALDIAGFIPIIGEGFDGINGLIYLAEGRYLEAGLSLVSAVPFLGNLAPAGKIALKGNWAGVGKVAGNVFDTYNGAVDTIFSPFLNLFRKDQIAKSATDLVGKGGKEAAEEGVEKVAKSLPEKIKEELPTDNAGWTHMGLGVGGSLPATSNVATIADALFYFKQGKYADAVTTAVSMIPGVGDVVTTIKSLGDDAFGRAAKKTAKELDADDAIQYIPDTTVKPRHKTVDLPENNAQVAERTTEETEPVAAETALPDDQELGSAALTELAFAPISQSAHEQGEQSVKDIPLIISPAIPESIAVEDDTPAIAKKKPSVLMEKSNEGAHPASVGKVQEQPFPQTPTNVVMDKMADKPADEPAKPMTDAEFLAGLDKAYGDRTTDILKRYGNDAREIIKKHGDRAVEFIGVFQTNDPVLEGRLLRTLDTEILDHATRLKPEEIETLAGWSDKELSEHGAELVLRVEKDTEVLADVRELIASGPIDPDKLTNKQQALIQRIAANSTQNPEAIQVVLGKWVDIGSGFVQYAKDTGSLHYNPHPHMWKLFESLGKENQSRVSWLVNKQVVQNGIEKGMPFEYSANGVLPARMGAEYDAIEAIFEGARDEDIVARLQIDYFPVRMHELQELYKAKYQITFDEVTNTYVFALPQKGN